MTIADIYEELAYGPAPEAFDPALRWLSEHEPFGIFVGGEWRSPHSRERLDVVNPATGALLTTAVQSDSEDVDAAVEAARAGLEVWGSTPLHVRARYLYALARAVQRHSRLFAVLESLDNGKPIRESRDIDIPLVARHFYYYAGWAQLLTDEFPGFEPVGVVGQIVPWNFPLLMLAWKVAPALAAGNAVILKPAEFTPLTSLLFAEIVERAGLPAGVVNIVTGDGRTGQHIVRHTGVNKIAFTGSTEVGRIIRRETAGTGKKLSLELGGKSPFIVFDDADLDSAVEGVVDAIWFNQGQVCCAGSRLLLQEAIEERFLSRLRSRMETLRIGDSLDKAVDMGAIIAPVQLSKIERLVALGVADGADMWQPSWACPVEGTFYPPTLFTRVSPAATIAQVEIFGPVLVAMTFRTPDEAVALANNTPYGLAASIWTENVNVAGDAARRVKAGTVWVNCTNVFDAASGFGGYRESGFGREGGKEGLYEYLRLPAPPYRAPALTDDDDAPRPLTPGIDRTAKLYVGGTQTRPDSGYSRIVHGTLGQILGEVGEGNRKDVRNAVEAAHAASKWDESTAHTRAQILYYLAENLATRSSEFAARLRSSCSLQKTDAEQEVEASIDHLFAAAAWADKFEGSVHRTPFRGITLAVPEPLGVLGIVCPDESPLLSFVSLVASAVAMGNTVVAVPSEQHPLSATDLYQVLETSDIPAGVINIVTGSRNALAEIVAQHDDVDGIWYFGDVAGTEAVERASAGNMKRTWCHHEPRDWYAGWTSQAREFLRESTQVKNIWVPHGA